MGFTTQQQQASEKERSYEDTRARMAGQEYFRLGGTARGSQFFLEHSFFVFVFFFHLPGLTTSATRWRHA